MKPHRPILIWDGDCNFCRYWIETWKSRTGNRVEFGPYQKVGQRFRKIPASAFEKSVQFVETDGKVYRGAEAVFRALSYSEHLGWLFTLYRHLPPFAWASEKIYRFIADRRMFFSKLTRFLWGDPKRSPGGLPRFNRTRDLFLRGLGAIYLLAFASAWVQIEGLLGSNGITPAEDTLKYIASHFGNWNLFVAPTLLWLSPGSALLHVLCAGGIIASTVLIVGRFPALALAAAWIFYLSIVKVGGVFFQYQWDALLLEAGFLAIFLTPWRARLGQSSHTSFLVIWLFRLLVFRLLFSSGVVKLQSGDVVWSSLRALEYHYFTQPLPNPLSWYLQQLPSWLHQFCAAGMFLIEIAVPFLVFLPRRPRFVAFAAFVVLQALIFFTGNYGFFNPLTILICFTLLDDGFVERLLPRSRRRGKKKASAAATTTAAWVGRRTYLLPLPERFQRWLTRPVGILLLAAACVRILWLETGYFLPSQPLKSLMVWTSQLSMVNSYGLFAVMTTWRPEIIIEGSEDGRTWKAYEFPFKPGDPMRAPSQVAPHMPRLDWQLWFAALQGPERATWMQSFLVALQQGRPEVLALLKENPFPDAPPKWVRAQLYTYQFTDSAERQETGRWWTRVLAGEYLPARKRVP